MGIRSASATFSRFHVEAPVQRGFWKHVDGALKQGAFSGMTEDQSQSSGFASWDDLFDTDFEEASYHKGEYVAFQLRTDRRRVPPILIRQQTRLAVEAHREDHEGKWPSRKERERIREDVVLRLLGQTLALPAGCDVTWNTRENRLLVGSTARKTLETVWERVEDHLRLHPVPLYHVRWALQLLPPGSPEVGRLTALVSPESSGVLDEGRFLGYEFLTWLWRRSEEEAGRLRLPDEREAEIHLGERLVLSRPDNGQERVVCTTPAGNLHEARTALRRGKLVEEAQLYLHVGDNEYSLTLDASLWTIRSLRTPKRGRDPEEDDPDGRFLERMYFVEEVLACLDAAYASFLGQRLGGDWEARIRPRLQAWSQAEDD